MVIEEDKELEKGRRFSYIGLALVGSSAAYMLTASDDKKVVKGKKAIGVRGKSKRNPTSNWPTTTEISTSTKFNPETNGKRQSTKRKNKSANLKKWKQSADSSDTPRDLLDSKREKLGEAIPLSPAFRDQYKKIVGMEKPDDLFEEGESVGDWLDPEALIDAKQQQQQQRRRVGSLRDTREDDFDEGTEEQHTPPSLGSKHSRGTLGMTSARNMPVQSEGPAYDYDDNDAGESALPPYATIIPAPVDSQMNSAPSTNINVQTSATAESEAPPAARKGLLGRLFKKSGAGRPTDVRTAVLGPSGKDFNSAQYRSLVAACLAAYVPSGCFPELEEGGDLVSSVATGARAPTEEERVQALRAEIIREGLSEQQAADAFADVVNALVVRLVDSAAETLDRKGGFGFGFRRKSGTQDQTSVGDLQSDNDDGDDSDDDGERNATVSKSKGQQKSKEEIAEQKASVQALDDVSDFIRGAGAIFSQTTPSAKIEPIQYNGRYKKGKLETLYYRYAKSASCMSDMSDFISIAENLVPAEDPSSAEAPATGERKGEGEGDEEAAAKAAEAALNNVQQSSEDKADRLSKIQFLFGIKQGKRAQIESRIQREQMMQLLSGAVGAGGGKGGGGDLAAMVSNQCSCPSFEGGEVADFLQLRYSDVFLFVTQAFGPS